MISLTFAETFGRGSMRDFKHIREAWTQLNGISTTMGKLERELTKQMMEMDHRIKSHQTLHQIKQSDKAS